MIKIIKGIYGKREGSSIVRVNKNHPPFELSEAEEKRLVADGWAEYVKPDAAATPAPAPEAEPVPAAEEPQSEPEAEAPQGEAAPALGDEEPIDFDEMTIPQLKTYAEQNGVELKSNLPKAKIIAILKAAVAE